MTRGKRLFHTLGLLPEDPGSDSYRHLWLLLFWPVYGLVFTLLERVFTADYYLPMYCALDDWIPFREGFVVFYAAWYFYLAWIHIYTLRHDVATFRRLMYFLTMTFGYAICFCIAVPNCQELRPASFERDNIFTRLVGLLYAADTNTNVSPSMHVLGALGVMFAAWELPRFRTPGWRCFFAGFTALICLSTVFIKQHSALDIATALPVSLAAYVVCFWPRRLRRGKAKERMCLP